MRVNQDTRLNYRILDIRTPANQAIFRIQCKVGGVGFFYHLAPFFNPLFPFLNSLFFKNLLVYTL